MDGGLMTKQHLQEKLAKPYRGRHGVDSPDREREIDMALSRTLREEILQDEEVLAEVRCRLEQGRVYSEAYGQPLTTQAYVKQTLQHLADVLKERHLSKA